MDEPLWFCIDKMEKQLDLLYLSVKYQDVKTTTLVPQKFIETPFSRNNNHHDVGWGMEAGDFACHPCCAYPLARPLPAAPIDKPTGGNSHLHCQCYGGPMAWMSPATGIWAGLATLCCLPYPLEAAGTIWPQPALCPHVSAGNVSHRYNLSGFKYHRPEELGV